MPADRPLPDAHDTGIFDYRYLRSLDPDQQQQSRERKGAEQQ